jgi:16S rRNA (cytidine1402-2'-O)-methyltransferase
MGKLYVVGTPIGNLGDFSPRAQKVLSEVDFIAAEDTRVTIKLLNHFNIKNTLISYHEHNRFSRGEEILEKLLSGQNGAVVTDAGMPAISDPGEDLVRLCRERGVEIEAVPGPTAFATAVAISGLAAGRFTFEGFLSVNKRSRKQHLEEIKNERRTMIFYEAPHKLPSTLCDLYKVLGEREIVICRELTKIHEEVLKMPLSAAAEKYKTEKPIGEIVLIIQGSLETGKEEEYTLDDAVEIAQELIERGEKPTDAAKQASAKTGIKKGDIYKKLTNK